MTRMNTIAPFATLVLTLGLAACGNSGSESAMAPPATGAETAAAAPSTPPPSLATKFEMSLTEMGAKITPEGMRVTLGSADFGSGSSDFKPENAERIDSVAGLLKERTTLRLIVAGYTDNKGSSAANKRLSQERAESVRDFLVKEKGLDASRIDANGMGDADPVASNETEEGRADNRRVELRIVNQAGGYETLVRF